MGDARFLGIDLAWGAKARTGLAAVDASGRLLASGIAITDDEIHAWIDTLGGAVLVAAVDAPLVVPNVTGQRRAEGEVQRAYGKYCAGPYPCNRANPLFDPPRAETIAAARGWCVDPDVVGRRDRPVCIEVYPHPGMVGLFKLPQRVLYKKGPNRRAGFEELVRHFETLPELGLRDNERWRQLQEVVAAPKPGDLNRIEDEIDAIFCAHLAWLWHHRPGVLQVYGALEEGYIVAPPPPTHPATRTIAPPRSPSVPPRRA
jgi:predicted RNase H-like nuclease